MMNRKLKITLWILLPIVVILPWNWQLVYLLLMYQTPHMDDAVSESWSLSNGTFEVFVDMHLEQGGFMPALGGAYYVYGATPPGSNSVSEIMTVRIDDPNPIERDSVQFVSDDIGFVYFGPKYAVTLDSGKTWKIWDAWEANKKLAFDKYKLYGSIEEVKIEPSGNGAMRLYSTANTPIRLKSNDFGVTWIIE